MVAMLPGENRMIGTIMLANRFGIERGYSAEDLRLLEALANNASVALQYDRLEQAVTKLRRLQEQLHHQAYHDPLTDLPNRSLFMERVAELATRRRRRSRCSSSTSTTSRSSTTRSATPSATRCSYRSPGGCGTPSARRTWSPAWAATSSRSCSRRRRPGGSGAAGGERACCSAFELPVHAGGAVVGAPQRRHHRQPPQRATPTS